MARILFVDDDSMTLETMTNAVQIFGHESITASTGKEAFRLAASQSPDLIFIDMFLPDMDGLALISALRSQPATADIPMYILSAGPELDAQEKAQAAGARAYLSKPIRLQTLLDVIEKNSARV